MSRRQSIDSVASSSGKSFGRSRSWSGDLQKTWLAPVLPNETLDERITRYEEYFSLTKEQLLRASTELQKEMKDGLMRNREGDADHWAFPTGLRMVDTLITHLPTGKESGTACAVDFSMPGVRVMRAHFDGAGHVTADEKRASINDMSMGVSLTDSTTQAIDLFDWMATKCKGVIGSDAKHTDKVGFSVGFPCAHEEIDSATLPSWIKGFETGRATKDPVEDCDLATLLDMAFWRNDINAKVNSVASNAACTLLACSYEKPAKLPACLVAIHCSDGLNAAYVEPHWRKFGYRGKVINTEVGGFDTALPVTDVDMEIDFADEGGHGKQVFEKMISCPYLGEICRRVVLKVWRDKAPAMVWSRQAMPTAAAAIIAADHSTGLTTVDRVLKGLWDWNADLSTRIAIQKLFGLVFNRSAGFVAVLIAALGRATGRLQPAMGGLTVALDGGLHAAHTWYSDHVSHTYTYIHKHTCMHTHTRRHMQKPHMYAHMHAQMYA